MFLQAGRVKEALEICTSIIEKDANNVDAFCDRAEAHIINEDFEAGKAVGVMFKSSGSKFAGRGEPECSLCLSLQL